MYTCVSFYVVVNDTVMVNIGENVTAREDIQVVINCTQLVNNKINSGVRKPTVKWYKNGRKIKAGSEINVELSEDKRICVITDTLLAVGGQPGTDGNYTCKVCGGNTKCLSGTSIQAVCGK